MTARRAAIGWAVALCLACVPDDLDPDDDGGADDAAATLVMGETGELPPCFELPLCDPLSPECPGTQMCLPEGEVFTCAAPLEGTEQLGLGDPCDGGLSCQAGLACLPIAVTGCSGSAGCCIALCELDAPQCAGGFSCSQYFSQGTASTCYASVGVCVEG
ncbi:MAG: hypothetical protein AAF721_37830 [Myxococcota bacterium]